MGGASERATAAAAGPQARCLMSVGGYDVARPNPRIFPRDAVWKPSWDLGVNVSWPLFDGGRVRAEVAEADANRRAIEERLKDFDATVEVEVRQRVTDLVSAEASVAAAEVGVRSAAEARRVLSPNGLPPALRPTPMCSTPRSRSCRPSSIARGACQYSTGCCAPGSGAGTVMTARHQRPRSHAAVRRLRRRRPHQFQRGARRDLRVPRRQRRRQVDDDSHALRVAQAHIRHGARRWCRREPRSRTGEAAHRLHVAEIFAIRAADGRSEHPFLRRAVRAQRRSD